MTLTPIQHMGRHHEHHDARGRVNSLLDSITRAETLGLAEEMLELLVTEEHLTTRQLTQSESDALARMGVGEDDLRAGASLTPRLRGQMQEHAHQHHSLSASEVADRLGVTATRVRQRAADGSLLARRLSDGWHFPAFQFTEHGEPTGWATVAKHIPPGTPLTLVYQAFTQPNTILTHATETSIAAWLNDGGDVGRAAEVMDILLNRVP